eukprot:Phypoly_transcript_12198.p1 GENE.Phypoly_transcript_12198~~Phypoly_transcript_12198.p1  ORF type:complete len:194 (+),score=35.93 Phypoly_transcript_12198:49-582(+)
MEPVFVQYCGVCTLPIEYCEFTPTYEKCKKWQQENGITQAEDVATDIQNMSLTTKTNETTTSTEPKEEVKLLPGGKIKKKEVPNVYISRTNRNKRKYVTTVTGLEMFGIKLPDAAKLFAKKFSCGSSVVKNPSLVEEIDIQGDVKDDIVDFIREKWPQITEKSIFFIEEGGKKTKAK